MTGRRARLAASAAAAAALVQAGCATAPTSALQPSLPSGGLAAEQQHVFATQNEAARRASETGRMREALWRWRIMEAVSPDKSEARRSADALQARISQEASAAVERGDAARHAHNDVAAAAAYRQALLLVPDHSGALRQLRELEAGTVLRDVNREQSGARRKHRPAKAASKSSTARSAKSDPGR